MHFILLKYIHYIIRYMCFYKNRLNLPRSPLYRYKLYLYIYIYIYIHRCRFESTYQGTLMGYPTTSILTLKIFSIKFFKVTIFPESCRKIRG